MTTSTSLPLGSTDIVGVVVTNQITGAVVSTGQYTLAIVSIDKDPATGSYSAPITDGTITGADPSGLTLGPYIVWAKVTTPGGRTAYTECGRVAILSAETGGFN